MRKRIDNRKGLTGNAIAGTHVAFLGPELTQAPRPGFRGFAFQRVLPTAEVFRRADGRLAAG